MKNGNESDMSMSMTSDDTKSAGQKSKKSSSQTSLEQQLHELTAEENQKLVSDFALSKLSDTKVVLFIMAKFSHSIEYARQAGDMRYMELLLS